MAVAKRKKTAKKCKVPGCNKKATSRDNCPTCRKAFLSMIEQGVNIDGELVTEDWLVAKGWTAAPKRKGRPAESAAVKAVRALRK